MAVHDKSRNAIELVLKYKGDQQSVNCWRDLLNQTGATDVAITTYGRRDGSSRNDDCIRLRDLPKDNPNYVALPPIGKPIVIRGKRVSLITLFVALA